MSFTKSSTTPFRRHFPVTSVGQIKALDAPNSAVLHDEVVAHFDDCVEVFRTFDGPEIARYYLTHYCALSAEGDVKCYTSFQEMASQFQHMADDCYALGVRDFRYKDLETMPLGTQSVLATITWEHCTEDECVLSYWRESYILVRTETGLRAFASVDHAL